MEREKGFKWPKVKLPADFWMLTLLTLLLIPAIIFWTSVILYTGLGTDYMYDVVLAQLSRTAEGNMLIIFLVVGCPAIMTVISWMEYKKAKKKKFKWQVATGVVFFMLGLLAALIKF